MKTAIDSHISHLNWCRESHQCVSSALIATRRFLRLGPSARQVRLIALKEFNDRLRSGWVLACVLLWLGAIGLTSFFGLLQIGHIGAQGYERTVISLLNLVQYLVPLLGLLLGHDLVVNEVEERTLRLILSSGVSRTAILVGKFVGGCLALAVPLLAGFFVSGMAVGIAAHDNSCAPFIRLAVSGLALGIVFVGVGLLISTFSRTRVQSLVLALLTWCLAVFVFDLVALGLLVTTKSPVAAQEIEIICDATHVNTAADPHSEFDTVPDSKPRAASVSAPSALTWVTLNPVDLFRASNLQGQLGVPVPPWVSLLNIGSWLTVTLATSLWKLNRTHL